MTTVTNLTLELHFGEFLQKEGPRFQRPEVRETAEWALDVALDLVDAGLVYDWIPARVLDERRVEIGGYPLALGRHADLLKCAVEACVSVVTIGPNLEQRVRELMSRGDAFKAYVLDEVGVFAVASAGLLVHDIVEEEAARRGWGVGAELAPGQLGRSDSPRGMTRCSARSRRPEGADGDH